MKRIYTSLVLLLILLSVAVAQSQDYKMNHVFVELGGNGKVASFNYERFLYKNDVSLRVGYGMATQEYATLLASLNYYLKTKSECRFWQVGLGGTFSNADLTDVVGNQPQQASYKYILPTVGHKWNTENRFTFQVTLSPFVGEGYVFPWGGLSFGKQF